MKIPIFYVDTFTDKIFTGNPAAVYIVEEMPLESIIKCYQASSRGGFLKCEVQGNKLFMSSEAVLYMQGVITL